MAENSKIEWAHHTFNPWRGCTKISPGCAHCYAETLSKRNPKALGVWGDNGTRVVAAESYWRQPVRWNAEAMAAGERRRVFCASLADVFEDRPELEAPRQRLFNLIALTPALDWLLLTKRPQNVQMMCLDIGTFHNVWLGVSVEDQQRADERIPQLLRVPARVRFLSVEPLLRQVNLGPWLGPWTCDGEAGAGKHDGKGGPGSYCGSICRDYGNSRGPVDWVIVGGESGPRARSCSVGNIRYLVQQCKACSVRVFVKQLGAFPVRGEPELWAGFSDRRLRDLKGGDPEEWPRDLRVREFPKVGHA